MKFFFRSRRRCTWGKLALYISKLEESKYKKEIYKAFYHFEVWSEHCKPSPFDKQFCMANTAVFISYITFQSYQKKIFQWGKSEFLIFLFVLLYKIKTFTLETVHLPHQLLYMLFLTPVTNFWGLSGLKAKTLLQNVKIFLNAILKYIKLSL